MLETDWNNLEGRPQLDCVHHRGVPLRAGDRVRICPKDSGDILDMALKGKTATIEAIEQDYEDNVHVAVVIDDDPGRDLGMLRQPGHRFFYSLDEVEPMGFPDASSKSGRDA